MNKDNDEKILSELAIALADSPKTGERGIEIVLPANKHAHVIYLDVIAMRKMANKLLEISDVVETINRNRNLSFYPMAESRHHLELL